MTTLLLFCKRPKRGVGKQRLAQEIGTEAAYQASSLLFECALEDLIQWNGPRIIAPAESEDTIWAEDLIRHREIDNCSVIAQGEGNMGARIERIDSLLRSQGDSSVVIIGSDSPAHTPEHFTETKELLQKYDVVLTPADDGGVTLMANRSPWTQLHELPWSSDQFCDALSRSAESAGLSVGHTTPSFDIDTRADLLKFHPMALKDPRPSRQFLGKWISTFLSIESTCG